MDIININSEEAWRSLMNIPNSILVDVRTKGEWEQIGKPKLQPHLQNKLLLISWRILPDMSINPRFKEELAEQVMNKEALVYFICRSGSRSFEAADYARTLGYKNCYNVTDGFEGNYFGLGWKSNNLPWEYLENVS